MKKSKLLLVALCALPLAACSGGRSQTVMSTFSSGSKISKALIEQNNSSSVKLATVKQYSTPDGYLAENLNGDIYVVSNDGFKTLSLYLLSEGKIFASNVEILCTFSSSKSPDYIYVKDAEGNYVTYAYNGVVVHSSKIEDQSAVATWDEESKSDILYYPVENVYVAFDGKEGKLVYTSAVTDHIVPFVSMEQFGRKEYSLSFDFLNSQVIVKKDGGESSYYKLPYNMVGLTSLDEMTIVGDYIFFAQREMISAYNADYQFEYEGKKYTQTIGRFNYTNGSYDESVLNYAFESGITPIKDEKGYYTLGVAPVMAIRENKVVNQASLSYFIVGTDLKLYDDVTYFTNFDKKDNVIGVFQNTKVVEENGKVFYINTDEIVGLTSVYDQNLNIIRSFIAVQLMSGTLLQVNNGGYVGIINYKGEIVVPFKYSAIYGYVDGKLIVGRQDGEKEKFYSVSYGLTAASYSETEIADLCGIETFKSTGEVLVYHQSAESVVSAEVFDKNGTLLIKLDDVSAGHVTKSYSVERDGKGYNVYTSISTAGKTTYTVFEYDVQFESSIGIDL